MNDDIKNPPSEPLDMNDANERRWQELMEEAAKGEMSAIEIMRRARPFFRYLFS